MTKASKEKQVDARYKLGSWKGHPNYECTKCAYATLDLNLFNAHWAIKHIVLPKPSPILLANASGREIKPVVTDDDDEDFETEVSEDVDLEA
jgi:hypothetical protein